MKTSDLLVVIALGCASCHNPSSYDITSPDQADAVMQLSASTLTAPADGLTRVTLTVAVSPMTKPADRTVRLTTTAGSFVPAGASSTETTVTVDALGNAVALLQAPDAPAVATVNAAVPDFARSINIAFQQAVATNLFSFSASATSIPADGFSQVQLTVIVAFPGNAAQRTVTFKTSAGLLVAPGSSTPSSSVVVPADGTGTAIAYLRSSTNVSVAQVQAVAANATQSLFISFTSVNPQSVFMLTAPVKRAPADGATTTTLTATVGQGLAAPGQSVAFVTSAGTFVHSGQATDSLPITAGNSVSLDLRSPATAGVGHVVATAGGFSSDLSISFDPALPDQILLTVPQGTLAASTSASVNVTANLLRTVGTVTPNQVVDFSATDSSGAPIGAFFNTQVSNAMHIATTQFAVGAIGYRGPVTLTATVSGATVIGTASIQIVSP
jgi:hypothetical protein